MRQAAFVVRFLASAAVATLLAGWVPAANAADPNAPFRDCPDCPEMQRLPPGTFVMGTPAADPRAADTRAEAQALIVRVPKAFAMGRLEITRREYRAFVNDAGYEVHGPCVSWDDALGRFNSDRTRGPDNPGRPREVKDDQPVSCVSWSDAKAYVQWLAHRTGKAYRLPSEAEWEYAARAGSAARWPWGDSSTDACDFANLYDLSARESYAFGWDPVHCRDSYPDVAPAAALRANAFGLYDMIGNVAEWVEDCYTDSYVGRPRDTRAWVWAGGCSKRVQRGGSWAMPPERARSASREAAEISSRADSLGFRVALDLDGKAESR
ncbi:MAG: SUMF1/EgtB/PvdO family nonheme iron enzyme [Pseudomonadota bacterium]